MTLLRKCVGVSKDIDKQNKFFMVEHKQFCHMAICHNLVVKKILIQIIINFNNTNMVRVKK